MYVATTQLLHEFACCSPGKYFIFSLAHEIMNKHKTADKADQTD